MATTASDINVLHKCVRAMNLDGFSVYPSIKWLVILHNVEMPRIIKCANDDDNDDDCVSTMTIFSTAGHISIFSLYIKEGMWH